MYFYTFFRGFQHLKHPTNYSFVVMCMLLLLMLQDDDIVTEGDAVTSVDHRNLSNATKNRQNESISDSSCQEGSVFHYLCVTDCVAVASAVIY